MKKTMAKIISLLITISMICTALVIPALADASYTYAAANINANGTTSSWGIRNGNPDNTRATLAAGGTVTLGEAYPSYGKTEGDIVYRWTGLANQGNMMAWANEGNRTAAHDQVGEFNFRLNDGAKILFCVNSPGENIYTLSSSDNGWHHFAYTFNFVSKAIKFYVDGELISTVTLVAKTGTVGTTNGFYIRSGSAMSGNMAIEVDDIRAWALDTETSGQVTYDTDGETVLSYDSFDYIVSEKLDLKMPVPDGVKLRSGSILVNDAKMTCADLIDTAEHTTGITSARIFDSALANEYTEDESVIGKTIVLQATDKNNIPVVVTYPIALNEYNYTTYEINANGTTTSLGSATVDNTRTLAPATTVEVGAEYPGYGKAAGDRIYRWTGLANQGNMMAWCHGGSKFEAHDQVGEFNYRLQDGAKISIQNNMPGGNIVTLTSSDNLWHHLNYAFNFEKRQLTFYVDGSLLTTKTLDKNSSLNNGTGSTNGFYLRAGSAMSGDMAIEIDDLKAWALDKASSADVTYEADGVTVKSYDSYDYIVANKLDLSSFNIATGNKVAAIEGTKLRLSGDSVTCAELIADLASNSSVSSVAIYSADFSQSYSGSESAADKIVIINGTNASGSSLMKSYTATSRFSMYNQIYADGNSLYLGSVDDNGRIVDPSAKAVTVGVDSVTGSGKENGDKFYRFTAANTIKYPTTNGVEWSNLMAWGYSDSTKTYHDQVGSFNYRMSSDALSFTPFVNKPGANLMSVQNNDNRWHKFSYAFNAAKGELTWWIDGVEQANKYNCSTFGLYLRVFQALNMDRVMPADAYIDIDDLSVWTLDGESSGITSENEGETVYDSYDALVSSKLDIALPAEVASTSSVINADVYNQASDELAFTSGLTVNDICALVSDGTAAVFDASLSEKIDGTEDAEDEMVLAIKSGNKFRYYDLGKYTASGTLWHKTVKTYDKGYKLEVFNPTNEEMTVVAYTKNLDTPQILKNAVILEAGQKKTMGLYGVSNDRLMFYIWNDSMEPFTNPMKNFN